MSDRHVYGTDMKCPVCDTGMIPMDVRRYETLVEHVSNPNGRATKKVGYGCPNMECRAFGKRWLKDGEGPYDPYFDNPSFPSKGLRLEECYPKGTLHASIRERTPT